MNKDELILKDVLGYEGLYKVSSTGNVYSLIRGKLKLLSPGYSGNGYRCVFLSKNKTVKKFYVHRIVWSAFNGPIPHGFVINHRDENITNNELTNLEVCTIAYNLNYGTRNERISKAKRKKIILTETVTGISCEFDGGHQASEFFGKSKNYISNSIHHAKKNNKNWIKVNGICYTFTQCA